jgi:hypothetical protein
MYSTYALIPGQSAQCVSHEGFQAYYFLKVTFGATVCTNTEIRFNARPASHCADAASINAVGAASVDIPLDLREYWEYWI